MTLDGNLYSLGTAEQGQLGRVPEHFSNRGGRKGLGKQQKPKASTHFSLMWDYINNRCFLCNLCGTLYCDFRPVARTSDGKSQREGSLLRCLLWGVLHLCCVKRGTRVWIWPL